MNSDNILDLENRRLIYQLVVKYAGCHYRDIERMSKLSAGVAKYHLSFLLKHKLIRIKKVGNTVTYFPMMVDQFNDKILALLRQRSIRIILLSIIVDKDVSHEEIVKLVGVSPSTVSWHLKKLEDEAIIKKETQHKKTKYVILYDQKKIIELLISYQESFMDNLVDKVIEMWG